MSSTSFCDQLPGMRFLSEVRTGIRAEVSTGEGGRPGKEQKLIEFTKKTQNCNRMSVIAAPASSNKIPQDAEKAVSGGDTPWTDCAAERPRCCRNPRQDKGLGSLADDRTLSQERKHTFIKKGKCQTRIVLALQPQQRVGITQELPPLHLRPQVGSELTP